MVTGLRLDALRGVEDLARRSHDHTDNPLGANTVDTTQLVDLAVTTAKLDNDAVTAAKIAAGAVDTSELAADAVTSAKIADGTITFDDVIAAFPQGEVGVDTHTTDSSAFSVSTTTDLSVDVAVTSGRIYHVFIVLPEVRWSSLDAAAEWDFTARADASTFGKFGTLLPITTGVTKWPIHGMCRFAASSTTTITFDLRLVEITNGATVTLAASSSHPRQIIVVDAGT